MGHRHSIAIINRLPPSVVSQENIKKIVSSLNQILPEVCRIWQIPKIKVVVTDHPTRKFFGYVILEPGNVHEGSLGFHSLDVWGIPFSVINYNLHVKNNQTLNYTGSVVGVESATSVAPRVLLSKTISHEIFEMMINPTLTKDPVILSSGKPIYREICDPVRSGELLVDGVIMSNFVYPSFFDDKGVSPFDHLGQVEQPLTLGSDQDYFTGPQNF